MTDRSEFGLRQAEMTAQWFENVKAAHGDVDAYIRTRHAAYMDRWREAGRFIADGARVLDIGGGNLFPGLLAYFRDRGFTYSYLDVDPSAVDSSRALAQDAGLVDATFSLGFNDQLDFPDGTFDAVFSSHCIEHSIDLGATFREVNRVLKPGGTLTMAVPFGWETNPEHPYFLGPDEWISLVEDGGFRVRAAQIANEYPESGEDYFIAASKAGEPTSPSRIFPPDYLKDTFNFMSFSDPTIDYAGAFDHRWDCAISAAPDSAIAFTPPAGAREVLPVLHRHPWSGTVRLSHDDVWQDFDLYSWFSFDMPARLGLGCDASAPVGIRLVGKNPASRWAQFVFKGYYWR